MSSLKSEVRLAVYNAFKSGMSCDSEQDNKAYEKTLVNSQTKRIMDAIRHSWAVRNYRIGKGKKP